MWIESAVVALLYFQVPQEISETLLAQEKSEESPQAAAATALEAAQSAQKAAEAAQRAAEATEQMLALMVKMHKPEEAPEVAVLAEEKAPSAWTTSANLGLIFLSGNSSSITLNGGVGVSHKTQEWIFGGRVYGAYGRARLVGADAFSDIAMQGGVDFRIDRRFTFMLSGYVLSGIDFDHIRSIEARPFIELGTGVIWIDTKVDNAQKTLLSTDFGLRYAYESRFRYYPTDEEIPSLLPEDVPTEPRNLPNVQVVAPRAAVVFRYMLTDGITFGEDFEVLLNVIEAKRFWVNSSTKILVRLTNVFSLSTALSFKYDSEPAEDIQKLDTILSLGLDAVF